MCGRITQKSPPNQLGLRIVSLIEPLHVPPRFNGAPGQEQWVIRQIPRQVSEAAGAWLIDEDEQGGAGYASSLPARGSEGR